MTLRTWLTIGGAIAGATLLPHAASASVARCVISSPIGSSNGPCNYRVTKGGSFTLEPMRQRYLVGNAMRVRVQVIRPGVARISSVSGYGTVRYWGNAWRSSRDHACWVSRSSSVCAY